MSSNGCSILGMLRRYLENTPDTTPPAFVIWDKGNGLFSLVVTSYDDDGTARSFETPLTELPLVENS